METKTTIKGLFANRYNNFIIPSYQRAYSWEEKNLETFLNDLKEQPYEKPYYLGHFLFEVLDEKQYQYGVIDGQQRITTVVIFMSCLIKELKMRKGIKKIVLKRKDLPIDFSLENVKLDFLINGSTSKLKTVDYDNNFFQNHIIKDSPQKENPNTTSQKRILNSKIFFENNFKDFSSEKLLDFYVILENADITTFKVENKIQAAQIFGFQNDRGKELTNLERLKSYFMFLLYLKGENSHEDIEYIENEFKMIYEKTERISMPEDEVLGYYSRAFYFGFYIPHSTLNAIKLKLQKEKNVAKWIREFCLGLRKAFFDIEKIASEGSPLIKDLRYLNRMAICYPFLLKGFRFITERSQFDNLFRLLEIIVFRVKLVNSRAEIEWRLNQPLINFNGDVSKLILDIKNSLDYWSDVRVKDLINSNSFCWNPVDNYLLWKYEGSLKGKGYSNIPYDTIVNEEIEHISPQTPTEDEPLANGYDDYTEEFINGYLNRLGNLMLISKSNNCSLGNKPFPEKLKSYKNNTAMSQHLEIQNFITDINNPVWNRETIEKRHKKIIDFAINYWSFDTLI